MAQYRTSDSENDEDIQITTKNYVNKSIAWEHFDVQDKEKRIATCNLCNNKYSYRTSVTNLVKHLQRKHNVHTESNFEIDNDGDPVDNDNEKEETDLEEILTKSDLRSKIRSPIWSYFKTVNPVSRIAVCLICNKRLSYSTTQTNLRRHLTRKHPHALPEDREKKRILFSTGDQLYEIKTTPKGELDSDEIELQTEMEEVYLEDLEELEPKIEALEPKNEMKKRKRKKRVLYSHHTDNSSDEGQLVTKRTKCDHSLDYFGKYLTSLLKQLPQQLSNQLQTDFIKQVMNAQLTYETNSAKKTSKSNGYSITITSKNETVPDSVTEELVGFEEVDKE